MLILQKPICFTNSISLYYQHYYALADYISSRTLT